MSDEGMSDAALAARAAEIASRTEIGQSATTGKSGEHLFGTPNACPFCKEYQDYSELWYNGPGSPPAWAFQCGDCGAQGPSGYGFERGDHLTAMRRAVELWNEPMERLDAAERERDALREALRNALASLVAATSLLERGGKKAAPSDKMFAQMLVDYNKSAAAARAALTANHSAPVVEE